MNNLNLSFIVNFCKEKIPKGHLPYVLENSTYSEVFEILTLNVNPWDYHLARKFINHKQVIEIVGLGLNLKSIAFAHSCYFGSDVGDFNEQRLASGVKNHDKIMLSAIAGFDAYEHAIFLKHADEHEQKDFLKSYKDIKWYAQLRIIGMSHESIMHSASKKIPLNLLWQELQNSKEVGKPINVNLEEKVLRRFE